MKLFLMLISLLIFTTQKSEAKLSVECIVDYLKFKYFDVDYFSSINSNSGNPSDCTNDIKSKVEEFNNEVRTKMNNHIARKVYADCVVAEIKESTYENYRLAALGADLKGVGLKFWKISDKNKYIESNQKKAQELEDDALIKCQGRKNYGEFFDSFYEQKKSTPFADDFEYCMRKYLSDKNILKSNEYGFSVNPKRISTERIRCDDIMNEAMIQMRDQIKGEGGQECATDKFISNGYLDEIIKIQVLSKLDLTPTQKETEKGKFVNQMIYLTNIIKSCPLKN